MTAAVVAGCAAVSAAGAMTAWLAVRLRDRRVRGVPGDGLLTGAEQETIAAIERAWKRRQRG